ncbi:MAG: tetratricopeptide repeat protein [Candidatus Korobacteraceae bacterium]
MKKYINLAAMLFVLTMCASPLWAQMEGSVKGTAKDGSGKPIVGATVVVYDSQTGRKYQFKTNAKGEYAGIGVYLGTYKFTLMQNGTEIDEHNNVPVEGGAERVVDFELAKDQGGGMTEEQKKQIEATQKTNEKIKGLNASLAQAKELEGAGNYDQAITVLQQAAQTEPNQDLIWAYLGDAQRGGKKYAEAVDSYQKALAIKPNNGSYLNGLADAYAKSGQTDKAVQTYAAAATADPPNAALYYYNEGAVFTNTGKIDEAVAAFDKAIELDPKRADAYYWKGVDLIGKATMKDNKMVAPSGTAEAFNKYLELQPNGKYADASKQMLATIGSSVDTSYKSSKSSSGSKKKPNQ